MTKQTNAANKKQVKRAEVNEKNRRRAELNDIRTVLGTKSGRRLMWRFMEYCRSFETVYDFKDNDPIKMAYNSGRQDVGHFFMSEIVTADENLLFKLMRENQNKEEELND